MDIAEHMLRTGSRGFRDDLARAVDDLSRSVKGLGLSWSLAWHDVVSRYRGSILGPFWITLSMAVMVLGIGFLYAELQNIPLATTLPFVALGIVFWGLISQTVIEGCESFVQASGMLSQTSLPMLTFVWRTVLRNLAALLHHLVIVVGVIAGFGLWRTMDLPLALAGVGLVLVNVSWMCLLTAIISSRFRDIPQIVMSIMQFSMFMTPVFWQPGERVGLMDVVLTWNPFFHMLDAIRAPLMGVAPEASTFSILVVMALAGWAVAFGLFTATRRRIVHYL